MNEDKKDLIVLVADICQEKVIRTVLTCRWHEIPCKEIDFDVYRYPTRDPGVYRMGHEFLREYQSQYRFCLIIIDYEFDGTPETPEILEKKINNNMDKVGWKERYKTIVIYPELEAWLWGNNQAVYRIIGVYENEVRRYAIKKRLLENNEFKPLQPKEIFEYFLRKQKIPKSSSIYENIAGEANIRNCKDSSFLRLKATLSEWFPYGDQ